MADLIDRQEAIKAIRCGHLSAATIYGRSDEGMMVLAESIRAINSLPSAQPEIIRCKDCKHHEDEAPGMVYCPKIEGGWVRDDWFCADAERRTDEQT